MTDRPRPARQVKFIDEYMVDRNGTQAAIRAGYSKKTANAIAGRLLSNVSIKAEIQRRSKRLAHRADVTAADILEAHVRIARVCEADERYSEAIRAWELAGKQLGVYTEQTAIEGIIAFADLWKMVEGKR
jgi:phage terminase small subunit